MTRVDRGVGLLMAAALVAGGAAAAQENFDQGKTGAQLFASDCAICHKSTRGMTKAGGIFGLQSFLSVHYTASRESAAAIAKYLDTVDRGAPAAAHASRAHRAGSRRAKAEAKPAPAKDSGKDTVKPTGDAKAD